MRNCSQKKSFQLSSSTFNSLNSFSKTTDDCPASSSSSSSNPTTSQQKSHILCFRLVSASIDELVCELNDDVTKKKYRINANICETYPNSPPVWFSESEDSCLTDIIEKLSSTSEEDNKIIPQVRMLIFEFCTAKNLPIPDLNELSMCSSTSSTNLSQNNDSGHVSTNNSDNENEDIESDENPIDDDDINDTEMVVPSAMAIEAQHKKQKEIDGISNDNWKLLEKVKTTQLQDHLKGISFGSPTTNDRLMKELRDIFKSEHYKNEMYSIELVNDSLYEWNIKLFKVDEDAALYEDLKKFKEQEQKDHILLSFLFKENFPFEPPFVRVVYPMLKGGYVLSGGAICMELLTKQGWSSAYCIESVILQIAATLVKGQARIDFTARLHSYSLSRAQCAFKSLSSMHEKNGWHTPNPKDG